jgi:hypothetical protein
MPFNLSILAASALIAIALVSLSGWPRLRLRTHSHAHGSIRVIELALILSRAAFRPRGWWSDLWRLAERAFARSLHEPAPAVSVEYVRPGKRRPDAVARSEMAIMGRPSAPVNNMQPPVKGAAAVGRRGWAECVVYVTLKVGNL